VRTFIGLLASLFTAFANAAADDLYRVSSNEMGISQFDFTVTEVERKPKASVLEIPGFHDRSAPASRWMMCAYTDLAVKRGFSYWASVYPKLGNNQVILVFPSSERSDDPVFETMNVAEDDRHISAVAVFARFCGIKVNPSAKKPNK